MRFGLEILREMNKVVELPIIIRISGDEKAEGGMTLEDAVEIVKVLEKEKVAAIHVTSGNVCLSPHGIISIISYRKAKHGRCQKK